MNSIRHSSNAVTALRHSARAFRLVALFLIFAIGGLCASAQAQVPLTINYQGYLTTGGASPVPVNAPQTLTFRIYDAATDGTLLWSATQADIPVTNGLFNVALGGPLQSAPFPPTLVFDKPYFLTVEVGADGEMSSRQAMQMVPYAYRAVVTDAVSPAATIAGSQVTGAIAGTQVTGTLGNATMPGAVPWVVASGPSQQAASNTGYIAAGVSPIAITLPAAPAPGDVVKVLASGAGGFTLAPAAGFSIAGINNVAPITWTPRESVRNWGSVASSADGAKLVAAVKNSGSIVTSTNSGANWTPRSISGDVTSIASSADGTKLVAVSQNGRIHTSINSGVNWVLRLESANTWMSVASSADGTKLVVAGYGGPETGAQIHTSIDSGLTWTPHGSVKIWRAVASSADGARLVAVEAGFASGVGHIHTSTDSGLTWIQLDGTQRAWSAVASSADGTRLVAVDASPSAGGQIYTSADSGLNWIARDSARHWTAVASSADGVRLVAVDDDRSIIAGGRIYTSSDSGVSWTARESARHWSAVASSAHGSKLVATVDSGQIYTWAGMTVIGGQFSTIELVYAGSGQWLPVNQQGSITLRE